MPVCPKCGRQFGEDKKFCSGCGAKLTPIPHAVPQPVSAVTPPPLPPPDPPQPDTRNPRGRRDLVIVALAALFFALAVVSAAIYFYAHSRVKQESANNPVYDSRAIRKKPRLLWKWKTHEPWYGSSGIEVAYGKAFVLADAGAVHAIDIDTGKTAWSFALEIPESGGGDNPQPNPVVSRGMVFAANTYGNIYALDSDTGKLKWKHQTGMLPQSQPFVDYDHLFYLKDGSLRTLEIMTGGLMNTQLIAAPLSSRNSGVVYRDNVYITSITPQALWGAPSSFVVSTKNGEVKPWPESREAFDYSMIFVGDLLFYMSKGTALFSVDIAKDIDKKPIRMKGRMIYLGAVYDGTAYMFDEGKRVFAVNTNTGRENWSIDTPVTSQTAMAMADGTLYFSCEGKTAPERGAQIDATLKRIYIANIHSIDEASPMTDKEKEERYNAFRENLLSKERKEAPRLVAVNANNGKTLWEINLGKTGLNKIAIVDGVLYFSNSFGEVYAYK